MKEELNETFELVNGPLDGCHISGINIPQTIYCPDNHFEDKSINWGRNWTRAKPHCYILDGYKYKWNRTDREKGPK